LQLTAYFKLQASRLSAQRILLSVVGAVVVQMEALLEQAQELVRVVY
jgi:hypothetical protein